MVDAMLLRGSNVLLIPWQSLSFLAIGLIVGLSTAGCKTKTIPEKKSQVEQRDGKEQVANVPSSSVRFENITQTLGIDSTYRNGEESDQYSIAESLGGGVGAFDFDLDGRIDLLFPEGGQIEFEKPLTGLPSKLYRNSGEHFSDVSVLSRVSNVSFYNHGIASADVDSDGFPDILITGYRGLQLWINCGDGTFWDATARANLGDVPWGTSAGWGDFDRDGHLDLYIATYVDWSWENNPKCGGAGKDNRDVCTPQSFPGLDDLLFWNNGDGSFTRDSGTAGLEKEGKGLGVLVFDVNYDSLPDIYVANDTTNNFLYLNQGARNFKEIGVLSGTAFDNMGIPNGSMGLAIFDHDDDQKCDLFVTNYERETFAVYHNDGKANFRHISDRTGINALGKMLVGFGTISGDFALSGREDIVVANGHVMRFPTNDNRKQEPLYIQNRPDRKLSRVLFPEGDFFSGKVCARGVIAPDLNSDGKLDLVFSNVNEPAVVLKNTSTGGGHWVTLRLIGTTSNRDAIGSIVQLETDKRRMTRQVIGGGSYLSQGPYSLHWGIPEGDILQRLRITWPSGESQVLEASVLDQAYTVVESPKSS